MGLDQKRDVPFEEAVTHWYDTVFLPVVEIIRKGEILSEFPKRTHADLYLWILRHRAELEKQLSWEVRTEAAAADFAAKHSKEPDRVLTRFGRTPARLSATGDVSVSRLGKMVRCLLIFWLRWTKAQRL